MSLAQAFIAELHHEATATRKHLERVSASKFSFKPHAKSMDLQFLSSHVAEIVSWTQSIMEDTALEIDMKTFVPWRATSSAELTAKFDESLKAAIATLEKHGDADFMVPWTFKVDGQTVFTLPRVVVMRSWVMSHLVHHRAQLGVYLRLLDIAVPSVYGPSADEQ